MIMLTEGKHSIHQKLNFARPSNIRPDFQGIYPVHRFVFHGTSFAVLFLRVEFWMVRVCCGKDSIILVRM